MRIEALKKYQGQGGISELPQPERQIAQQWVSLWLERAKAKGRRIENWYIAVLCARAVQEALHPHTSEWGNRMRQRKAGLARWRWALRHGGKPDPAEHARYYLKLARARRKREKEQADEFALGLENRKKASDRYTAKVLELASKGIKLW